MIHANIKIWADVDGILSLLRADGSALPDTVELPYRAGSGLEPWIERVRIFSNDEKKDVKVRLASSAALLPVAAGPGATAVPMTIRMNGRALSTTTEVFSAADLFTGSIPGASIAMPLEASPATGAEISAAGSYEGIVNIVLVQR